MINPVPAGSMSTDCSDHQARDVATMGNRHHNKKLRAAVRATMAKTGESYQTVLCRLRSQQRQAVAPATDVDLIPIDYFGIPLTIATFEILGDLSCVVTPGSLSLGPFPRNPLFALARQRSLS
jgi:hypothetical protein